MITLYSSPHSDPWYPLHFHKKYMYIVLADHDAISGVPIHNFVQVTCRYSGLVPPLTSDKTAGEVTLPSLYGDAVTSNSPSASAALLQKCALLQQQLVVQTIKNGPRQFLPTWRFVPIVLGLRLSLGL